MIQGVGGRSILSVLLLFSEVEAYLCFKVSWQSVNVSIRIGSVWLWCWSSGFIRLVVLEVLIYRRNLVSPSSGRHRREHLKSHTWLVSTGVKLCAVRNKHIAVKYLSDVRCWSAVMWLLCNIHSFGEFFFFHCSFLILYIRDSSSKFW